MESTNVVIDDALSEQAPLGYVEEINQLSDDPINEYIKIPNP